MFCSLSSLIFLFTFITLGKPSQARLRGSVPKKLAFVASGGDSEKPFSNDNGATQQQIILADTSKGGDVREMSRSDVEEKFIQQQLQPAAGSASLSDSDRKNAIQRNTTQETVKEMDAQRPNSTLVSSEVNTTTQKTQNARQKDAFVSDDGKRGSQSLLNNNEQKTKSTQQNQQTDEIIDSVEVQRKHAWMKIEYVQFKQKVQAVKKSIESLLRKVPEQSVDAIKLLNIKSKFSVYTVSMEKTEYDIDELLSIIPQARNIQTLEKHWKDYDIHRRMLETIEEAMESLALELRQLLKSQTSSRKKGEALEIDVAKLMKAY